MANLTSIGRPYALAAFEYARDKQQLPAWKAFLDSAACVARQPSVLALLNNPNVSSEDIYNLFHDVLETTEDTERNNFLRLLAQNSRLNALPEITDAFNAYYAALEKISAVRVVTAVRVDDAYKQKLGQALTRRIQHQVTLHCEIDPAILGGAIIHIGDRVIDGSIRGKLTRLLEFSLR